MSRVSSRSTSFIGVESGNQSSSSRACRYVYRPNRSTDRALLCRRVRIVLASPIFFLPSLSLPKISPPPFSSLFFPENFPTRHRRLDSDEAREEGEEARVIPNTESDGGAIDKSSEISFLGRARTSCLGLRALPAVNSRETAPRERSLADACVSGYVAPRRAVFTACPILELGGAKEGTGQGEGGGRAALFSSFPSPPVSLSRRLAPLPTDAVGGRPSPPLGCTTLHDFFTTDESYSRDILF